MRSILGLLVIGMCVTACDGMIIVISTGPTSLHPSGHIDGGTIAVGTFVSGTLTGRSADAQYQYIPPRDGVLVVVVGWDQSCGRVAVDVGGRPFAAPPGAGPPITARLPVKQGQSYAVRIRDDTSVQNGTINVPFTVTTSLE